ncbi:hypothetical protein HOLleu_26023 [Holothuria leucospilota]|uniref:Uncharacterized protein n=1 Tax=Holothuria leucospilota TaxID=206669 RepID=A0A9Q1BTH5_HOLLE|nr:hypothetical protein HOLleu_26023 [Holothuria leucospilota]
MALGYFSFSFFFLIYCMSADGIQQTTITNLLQFNSQITVSRFAAPGDILAEEIRNRKEKDGACGNGTIHGLVLTSILSDSPKQVLNPYVTNYQTLKKIDRMEETNDGTIFMFKGDDVMTLNIQHDKECQRVESTPLRNDFVQLTTNNHLSTSYPKPFDWGCESLGLNVSFCETLQQNRCGLERAGSDICATKFMTLYQPCPATFSIMNMTGFFQNEVLPFVSASELPLVSFEAEWVNSTQSAGLVFPCFTD